MNYEQSVRNEAERLYKKFNMLVFDVIEEIKDYDQEDINYWDDVISRIKNMQK